MISEVIGLIRVHAGYDCMYSKNNISKVFAWIRTDTMFDENSGV